MATIPGSQLFDATASIIAFPGGVNVVETSTGTGLPPAIPTDFNLEVYTGNPPNPTTPFSGYQGLAILSGGGHTLELISGTFAVTDDGTSGGNTLIADGANETISGGTNFINLILNGNNEVANGARPGGDFVEVNGTHDTVNGGTGPEAINVNAGGNTVNAGSGADTITASGDGNTIIAGSGPDTITAIGDGDTIAGGTGPELVNLVGNNGSVTAGSGADLINVFGTGDTVTAGSGSDTIGMFADSEQMFGGTGPASIIATGNADTVTAGSGDLSVAAFGPNFQFVDNGAVVYNDTITGFSQPAGDRIHLAAGDTVATLTPENGGTDTLITLSDGSTILLKGVSHVDNSFFN